MSVLNFSQSVYHWSCCLTVFVFIVALLAAINQLTGIKPCSNVAMTLANIYRSLENILLAVIRKEMTAV